MGRQCDLKRRAVLWTAPAALAGAAAPLAAASPPTTPQTCVRVVNGCRAGTVCGVTTYRGDFVVTTTTATTFEVVTLSPDTWKVTKPSGPTPVAAGTTTILATLTVPDGTGTSGVLTYLLGGVTGTLNLDVANLPACCPTTPR